MGLFASLLLGHCPSGWSSIKMVPRTGTTDHFKGTKPVVRRVSSGPRTPASWFQVHRRRRQSDLELALARQAGDAAG